MTLFEIDQFMPHPIETVFALTVDLAKAPHWHSFFTKIEQLTPNPISKDSQWKMHFRGGEFTLEITAYQPPHRVVFRGSQVSKMVPNFTIEMQPVPKGTQIHYGLHPDIPGW